VFLSFYGYYLCLGLNMIPKSSRMQEGTILIPNPAPEENNCQSPSLAQEHIPAQCTRVSAILARIGDKWSILVVMLLIAGPLRFNELRRQTNGISQRMLTLTVRGLERDGFVTRQVFPTVPPRVEYALTDLGRSLAVPVQGLGKWAIENTAQIHQAQEEFDARVDL
jgi:DNA-binding HxlR family transcriptional regulator